MGMSTRPDLDKVLFVISYMNEGDANSWKEEFFDTAEQTAAQTLGAKIDLGTYDNLIKKIVEDFSPYDAPKDAIYEIKELKMGNSSIEEHVSKFKMLVTKSKLAKNDVARTAKEFGRMVYLGGQTTEQLYLHEKRDIKDTKPRREYHFQQQQEDERERNMQILL
jgi:hypothetical protein